MAEFTKDILQKNKKKGEKKKKTLKKDYLKPVNVEVSYAFH